MPSGKGPRVTVITDARRSRESELYVQGKSQREIARMMDVEFPNPSGKPYSQQVISLDIKSIRKEWRSSRIKNFDEKIDMELARIDMIECEAWKAWDRSIGKSKKIIREKSGIVGADRAKISETIEELNGDPRFMQIALECVKKRCELLSLNPSQKLEMSGPVSITVKYEDVKQTN